jgi:hypothetical protein
MAIKCYNFSCRFGDDPVIFLSSLLNILYQFDGISNIEPPTCHPATTAFLKTNSAANHNALLFKYAV